MSALVKDKATAAWNDIAGSQTNKILCKASSYEIAGPKKKHVDYLIHLTSDPACHIPNLADLLNERLRNSKWVVVFKGLILAHNLMTLGNEKFLQCLATRSNNFALETFLDRSDVLSADMSVFVRKYAKYLGFVCTSYRMLALDICRIPKGEASPLKTMEHGKLLKVAGVAQQQLDLLLEIEMTAGELTNGVINTAFLMLYKDVIKLYTAYNDAVINLLEKFFEMKKQHCKETIDAYRKFITRQEPVQKFLRLAEEVGVDKDSHLNLRQVPADLLPALEGHLSEMDSTKKLSGSATSDSIKAASEKLAALKSSVSSVPETPPPSISTPTNSIPSASEEILEAQRKRFEELKRQAAAAKAGRKDVSPSASASKIANVIEKSPEELASEQKSSNTGLSDLFGLQGFSSPSQPTQSAQPSQPPAPAEQNPWAPTSSLPPSQAQTQPQTQSVLNPFQPVTTADPTNPWGPQNTGYQEVDIFTEIRGGQPDFDAVFGQHGQPVSQTRPKPPLPIGNGLGGILEPTAVGAHAAKQSSLPPPPQPVGLGGIDVESSLTKAAENLTMELGRTGRTGLTVKTEHQWKPSAPSVKTGGPNWQPQQIQPKTLVPGPQPAASKGGAPADWNAGMYSGYFPQSGIAQQPFMQPPTQVPAWPQQPVQPQDPFGPIGTQHPQLF